MEWMKHLMRGGSPEPPQSAREPASLDALVALTRSPDGRQRQAAVRALAASGHPPALPALLERANDWVAAIRRDASEALGNFLRPEFAQAWIDSLAAVESLARGRRADHTRLLEHIVGWLSEQPQVGALEASGTALPREIARLALRLRLRCPDASELRDRAWWRALLCADVVQAMIAAQHLRQAAERLRHDDGLATETLRQAVRVAMTSRFGGVRNAGLRVALARPGLATPSDIQARCFDASGNTRQLAIASLRADESAMSDLAARALAGTQAGQPLRTRALALSGLCSIDRQAGLLRSAQLRHDASPVLRALALRHLLAGADGGARDALVHEALVDPAPRVRKLAALAVRRGASPPALVALQSLVELHPHALASLCDVASRLSPWDSLDFLLGILARNDGANIEDVVRHLGHWNADMCSTYVTPSTAQRERLGRAWAALRDALPRELRDETAFHLRGFGVPGA